MDVISVQQDISRNMVSKWLLATSMFVWISFFSISLFIVVIVTIGFCVAVAIGFPGKMELLDPYLLRFVAYASAIPVLAVLMAALATIYRAARGGRIWALRAVLIANPLLGCATYYFFVEWVFYDQVVPISLPFRILGFILILCAPGFAIVASAMILHSIKIEKRYSITAYPAQWPFISLPIFIARYGALNMRIMKAALLAVGAILVRFLVLILQISLIAMVGVIISRIFETTYRLNWAPSSNLSTIFSALCSALFCTVLVCVSCIRALFSYSGARRAASFLLVVSIASFVIITYYIISLNNSRMFQISHPSAAVNPGLDFFDASWVLAIWLMIALRKTISAPIQYGSRKLMEATARTASDLAYKRREPPILLLRSFVDDEQTVPSEDASISFAFGLRSPLVRLEELVADVMFARAPLIALQNPSLRSRPVGAALDLLAHDKWNDLVLDFIGKADLVICFLGNTPSFLWEVSQIIVAEKLHKLILVFPIGYPNTRTIYESVPELARIIGFDSAEIERAMMQGVRALCYNDQTGTFCGFSSTIANSDAYTSAIVRCGIITYRNRMTVSEVC